VKNYTYFFDYAFLYQQGKTGAMIPLSNKPAKFLLFMHWLTIFNGWINN